MPGPIGPVETGGAVVGVVVGVVGDDAVPSPVAGGAVADIVMDSGVALVPPKPGLLTLTSIFLPSMASVATPDTLIAVGEINFVVSGLSPKRAMVADVKLTPFSDRVKAPLGIWLGLELQT